MNKGINSNKNSLSKEKNEKNRYPQTSSNNFQKKIIIKDLNLKTTVSSGPNKSKDINSDSYTKTDNNKSYNVNDLFPKLPLRDSIDKVNNLLLNNESELKILDLKKELNQRGLLIFEALLDVLEFSKLDPILEVFKSNQVTHQFFINRILEIIIVISN